MTNRSVIGKIFSSQILLFRRGMIREAGELDMFWENTRAQRQVNNVGYGGKKCR